MRNQIAIDEVMDAGDFALKASLYKIWPGVVTAYHAASAGQTQPTVDVQPGTHDLRVDTETGARISEPWPILPNVPLAMAKGGGASIAFAMSPGDAVLLLSFDLDPSSFAATGSASDPVHTARHTGAYWIALPFDITDPGAVADPGGDLVVTPPGGGGFIVLGPGATDFVALASKVDTALSDLATWVKTGMQAFAPSGEPAPLTFAAPFSPDSVAATLVKAK